MPLMTSGRVSTSRSLLPRSSRAWLANRWPRKSASVSLCRCTIVPIAPSRTRIREASCESRSPLRSSAMGFCSTGDQHRERIAGLARADADLHVQEASTDKQLFQLVVIEAKTPVAELSAHPLFVMAAEVEHEYASVRRRHAYGFGDRLRCVLRMMQRLREHRDIDRPVVNRQLLELAFLPDDVRH